MWISIGVTCVLSFKNVFRTQIRSQVLLLTAFVPVLNHLLILLYQNITLTHTHTCKRHVRFWSWQNVMQFLRHVSDCWSITCFLRSATSADVSFQSSKGMSITTFTPLLTNPWRVEKVSDMPCTYTSKSDDTGKLMQPTVASYPPARVL